MIFKPNINGKFIINDPFNKFLKFLWFDVSGYINLYTPIDNYRRTIKTILSNERYSLEHRKRMYSHYRKKFLSNSKKGI